MSDSLRLDISLEGYKDIDRVSESFESLVKNMRRVEGHVEQVQNAYDTLTKTIGKDYVTAAGKLAAAQGRVFTNTDKASTSAMNQAQAINKLLEKQRRLTVQSKELLKPIDERIKLDAKASTVSQRQSNELTKLANQYKELRTQQAKQIASAKELNSVKEATLKAEAKDYGSKAKYLQRLKELNKIKEDALIVEAKEYRSKERQLQQVREAKSQLKSLRTVRAGEIAVLQEQIKRQTETNKINARAKLGLDEYSKAVKKTAGDLKFYNSERGKTLVREQEYLKTAKSVAAEEAKRSAALNKLRRDVDYINSAEGKYAAELKARKSTLTSLAQEEEKRSQQMAKMARELKRLENGEEAARYALEAKVRAARQAAKAEAETAAGMRKQASVSSQAQDALAKHRLELERLKKTSEFYQTAQGKEVLQVQRRIQAEKRLQKVMAETHIKNRLLAQSVDFLSNRMRVGNQTAAGFRASLAGLNTGFGIYTSGTIAFATAMYTLTSSLRNAIITGAEFEAQMDRVTAVMDATGGMAQYMNQEVRDVARVTVFTANEVSEGLMQLGMAGLDASESMDALEPSLRLASIGMLDMGTTADIVTNTMIGMGIDMERLPDVVDDMATAITNSNMTIQQLGNSMSYVAPLTRSADISVQEIIGSLQVLHNTGIKASRAGTAMRTSMLALLAPTEEAWRVLEKYDIQVDDHTGKMRNWTDLLRDMAKANLSLAEVENLVGKRQAAGMKAMIDSMRVTERGTTTLEENTDQLRENAGAAMAMQEMMEDNLRGDWLKLISAVKDKYLEFYDSNSEGMRDMIQSITEFVKAFDVERIDTFFSSAVDWMERLLPLLAALKVGSMAQKVTSGIGSAISMIPHPVAKVVGGGIGAASWLAGTAGAYGGYQAASGGIDWAKGQLGPGSIDNVENRTGAYRHTADKDPDELRQMYHSYSSAVSTLSDQLGELSIKREEAFAAGKDTDEFERKLESVADAIGNTTERWVSLQTVMRHDTIAVDESQAGERIAAIEAELQALEKLERRATEVGRNVMVAIYDSTGQFQRGEALGRMTAEDIIAGVEEHISAKGVSLFSLLSDMPIEGREGFAKQLQAVLKSELGSLDPSEMGINEWLASIEQLIENGPWGKWIEVDEMDAMMASFRTYYELQEASNARSSKAAELQAERAELQKQINDGIKGQVELQDMLYGAEAGEEIDRVKDITKGHRESVKQLYLQVDVTEKLKANHRNIVDLEREMAATYKKVVEAEEEGAAVKGASAMNQQRAADELLKLREEDLKLRQKLTQEADRQAEAAQKELLTLQEQVNLNRGSLAERSDPTTSTGFDPSRIEHQNELVKLMDEEVQLRQRVIELASLNVTDPETLTQHEELLENLSEELESKQGIIDLVKEEFRQKQALAALDARDTSLESLKTLQQEAALEARVVELRESGFRVTARERAVQEQAEQLQQDSVDKVRQKLLLATQEEDVNRNKVRALLQQLDAEEAILAVMGEMAETSEDIDFAPTANDELSLVVEQVGYLNELQKEFNKLSKGDEGYKKLEKAIEDATDALESTAGGIGAALADGIIGQDWSGVGSMLSDTLATHLGDGISTGLTEKLTGVFSSGTASALGGLAGGFASAGITTVIGGILGGREKTITKSLALQIQATAEEVIADGFEETKITSKGIFGSSTTRYQTEIANATKGVIERSFESATLGIDAVAGNMGLDALSDFSTSIKEEGLTLSEFTEQASEEYIRATFGAIDNYRFAHESVMDAWQRMGEEARTIGDAFEIGRGITIDEAFGSLIKDTAIAIESTLTQQLADAEGRVAGIEGDIVKYNEAIEAFYMEHFKSVPTQLNKALRSLTRELEAAELNAADIEKAMGDYAVQAKTALIDGIIKGVMGDTGLEGEALLAARESAKDFVYQTSTAWLEALEGESAVIENRIKQAANSVRSAADELGISLEGIDLTTEGVGSIQDINSRIESFKNGLSGTAEEIGEAEGKTIKLQHAFLQLIGHQETLQTSTETAGDAVNGLSSALQSFVDNANSQQRSLKMQLWGITGNTDAARAFTESEIMDLTPFETAVDDAQAVVDSFDISSINSQLEELGINPSKDLTAAEEVQVDYDIPDIDMSRVMDESGVRRAFDQFLGLSGDFANASERISYWTEKGLGIGEFADKFLSEAASISDAQAELWGEDVDERLAKIGNVNDVIADWSDEAKAAFLTSFGGDLGDFDKKLEGAVQETVSQIEVPEGAEELVSRWQDYQAAISKLTDAEKDRDTAAKAATKTLKAQRDVWGAEDAKRQAEIEAAIANQRRQLQMEELNLLGDIDAIREMELETINESNKEVQLRIWALQDEQEQIEKTARLLEKTNSIRETANEALDPDLFNKNKLNEALSAFGFDANADLGEGLNKLSQINSEELSFFDRVSEGMSEPLANALEDASIPDRVIGILDKAWTDAGKIAPDFSVEGLYKSAGGMEELGITLDEFASNLDGYSGVIASAYKEQEQAAKELIDTLTGNANDALQQLRKSIDAEQDRLKRVFDDDMGSLESSLKPVEDSIASLESLSSSLKNAIENTLVESRELDRSRLFSARRTLQGSLESFSATGVAPDQEVIDRALGVVSQDNQQFYGSFEDYARDQSKTATTISGLNDLAQNQLSIEEKTLNEIKYQMEMLEKQYNLDVQALEDTYTHYENQLNELKGINTSVMSVEDAIGGLKSAISSLKSATNSQQQSSGLSGGPPTDHRGRPIRPSSGSQTPGSGGSDGGSGGTITRSFTERVSEGINPTVAAAWSSLPSVAQSALDRNLSSSGTIPSHAKGLDYVPKDDYLANLHEGEMVLTKPVADTIRANIGGDYTAPTEPVAASTQFAKDSRSDGSKVDGAEVLSAIRELISVVKSDSYNTNRKLVKLNDIADTIEKWDIEGQPKERTY